MIAYSGVAGSDNNGSLGIERGTRYFLGEMYYRYRSVPWSTVGAVDEKRQRSDSMLLFLSGVDKVRFLSRASGLQVSRYEASSGESRIKLSSLIK